MSFWKLCELRVCEILAVLCIESWRKLAQVSIIDRFKLTNSSQQTHKLNSWSPSLSICHIKVFDACSCAIGICGLGEIKSRFQLNLSYNILYTFRLSDCLSRAFFCTTCVANLIRGRVSTNLSPVRNMCVSRTQSILVTAS